jgi:hypothetical protein
MYPTGELATCTKKPPNYIYIIVNYYKFTYLMRK